MNIHSNSIKNNKRAIVFILLLAILISLYILVSYIDSKKVFSSEIKLDNLLDDMEICIGGEAVGIKILATGVLVMESEINKDIFTGDIILEVNEIPIDSNKSLISEIQKANGNKVILKIQRNNEIKEVAVIPIFSKNTNMYELGLWVKDSSAGVGTVSFTIKNPTYLLLWGME